MSAELGLYAQDRWTVKKMTVNAGVRFDYLSGYFPENHLGRRGGCPTATSRSRRPTRSAWKDISPRLGVVYDLFGDGRTAHQGQPRPLRPGVRRRQQRHDGCAGQPDVGVGQPGVPAVERRQQKLQPRLRPQQLLGAGPPRLGRRLLRHHQRSQLRRHAAEHEFRSREHQGLEHPAGQLGDLGRRAAPAAAAGSASTSATSAAGTATSASTTTWRRRRATTRSSASWRPSIRGCPTAAAT